MPPRSNHRIDSVELPRTGALVSRNVTIDGHRTSVRLEPYMWTSLFDICAIERLTVHKLCSMINERRQPGMSLTAAIRVFVMAYFRAAATREGHNNAGHGSGQPFVNTPFDAGEDAGDEEAPASVPHREERRVGEPRAAQQRIEEQV